MKPITVLFSGLDHRVRRRETMQNPPAGIVFKTIQPLHAMKNDHELTNVKGRMGITGNLNQLSRIWKYNNWISKEYLRGVDIVYTPGYLYFGKKPYIVEVDNVSVFTYYKLPLLALFKPLVRAMLRADRCRQIVCMSQAAKNSVVNYFNDERITKKCTVVYPYAGAPLKRKTNPKTVYFLFIAANMYLKGGQELVHAFKRIVKKHPQARLTMIAKTEHMHPELMAEIKANKNITFQEANLKKDALYKNFYSKADVFILPSYRDSFGLVYLEALRTGLPIISTDMFAAPEMAIDGRNGIIIPTPIHYFKENFLPNPEWWEADMAAYVRKSHFSAFEKKLEEAMGKLITNPKLRKRMSEESTKLLNERFAEEKRKSQLEKVIKDAMKTKKA